MTGIYDRKTINKRHMGEKEVGKNGWRNKEDGKR